MRWRSASALCGPSSTCCCCSDSSCFLKQLPLRPHPPPSPQTDKRRTPRWQRRRQMYLKTALRVFLWCFRSSWTVRWAAKNSEQWTWVSEKDWIVDLSLFIQHFQVSDLRTETAEGLAKLMYTGRISSAKMLSRLVLLWYNPVTEDDTRLRHCLGVFFQLYARESRLDVQTMSLNYSTSIVTTFCFY